MVKWNYVLRLKDYYSHDAEAFIIRYNQRTHTYQEVILNLKEIPKDLLVVQIPNKRILDLIRLNKNGNLNSADYLKKNVVHLHY